MAGDARVTVSPPPAAATEDFLLPTRKRVARAEPRPPMIEGGGAERMSRLQPISVTGRPPPPPGELCRTGGGGGRPVNETRRTRLSKRAWRYSASPGLPIGEDF